MSLKSTLIAASVLVVAAASMPASAAVIFQDGFDADSASSVLNFNSLANWTVSNGTVDYIRSGGFGISCLGGTGGCLDMDGSTGDAGRITSKQVFTLFAGVTYVLDFSLSGNQRGGSSDSVRYGFIVEGSGTFIDDTLGSLLPNAPFGSNTASLSQISSPLSVRLFFEGIGNDNVGAILDNVVLSDNRTAVPEPATLALLGCGLVGLLTSRRRKQ